MDFELHSYEGAGALRIGMRRDQIRDTVGSPVRTFRKTADATTLVDAFDEEGIYVYYDDEDVCEAIELASPAAPVFLGRALLGEPFAEVKDWLGTLDPSVDVDDSGMTAPTLGFGLYAPSAREAPLEPAESVIVFRRGYYG